MKCHWLKLFASIFCVTATWAAWQPANGPCGGHIRCLVATGSKLFAGVTDPEHGPVYLSSDQGITWHPASKGIEHRWISAMAASGKHLYAMTDMDGLYSSHDEGQNWKKTQAQSAFNAITFVLVFSGNRLFAATERGLFYSDDQGLHWSPSKGGLPNAPIFHLAISGMTVLAATDDHVFVSHDHGATWRQSPIESSAKGVWALVIRGPEIFAATCGGIYKSKDACKTWTHASPGMKDFFPHLLTSWGSELVAAGTSGVFLLDKKNNLWQPLRAGLTNATVQTLLPCGTHLFAGTAGGGVFALSHPAARWQLASQGLPPLRTRALLSTPEGLLAGTEGGGIFLSSNHGQTWTPQNEGLEGCFINALASLQGYSVAATEAGVFSAQNSRKGWRRMNEGLEGQTVLALLPEATGLVAGTYDGAYRLPALGAKWLETNLKGKNVFSLASHEGFLFAGTFTDGIYLSQSPGTHWVNVDTQPKLLEIHSLGTLGKHLLVGTDDGGTYLSTNRFSSAQQVIANDHITYAFADHPTGSFAGGTRMFRSTDLGLHWSPMEDGAPRNVLSLAIHEGDLYAGSAGVYRLPLPHPQEKPFLFQGGSF